MTGRRFAIVQEYVPAYRAPLFDKLAEALSAEGDELTVFAGEPSGTLAQRRDAVRDRPWLRKIRQREVRLLGKRLTFRALPRDVWRADLIVVEQARRNLDVPLLLLWPRMARKTALWGHGPDVVKVPSRLERLYSRLITRKAAWFFAYTPSGAEWAAGIGRDPRRTTTLYNSIDVGQLQEDLRSVMTTTSEHQVCFIGGLDVSKKISELIAIGEAAHRADPAFRLAVGGDGRLRSVVQSAADRLPWLDYRGAVSGRAKAAMLRESELLLLPGRVGLAAIDSLTAGRPIVTLASSLHGPEFGYLEPGRTCVVSDGIEAAARSVVMLLRDPQTLATMQDSCRRASQKYSIENMAQYFHSGLKEAVKDDDE
ncbi:glycosyltransferase family 4 protein [Curtobacterium flaccumfaciens pv. flaccumfaciens]|uniref:glycosyltransferase family 4 protein n=1 Tax=Curtobacterium poinsettiae TaxID=159612 RepID=UPI00217DDF1E|nr:glycosyltransferase family 4 protein [Curtobacterium flaccumfaciens]MCS6574680.1 glycosyltransferase family 4 protein [Curtobacterium flaccumfaciens pv. flaccumfaciens]